MARVQFNQTQSGINQGIIDLDKTVGLLMYNDKLPPEWLPTIAAWVTGTAYVVGSQVYDSVSEQYYNCVIAHTSGATFADDVANWNIETSTVKVFENITSVQSAGIVKDSSQWAKEWYQINEVYRMNDSAVLSVYIVPSTSNAYDFSEMAALQSQSAKIYKQKGFDGGSVSGIGIYAPLLPFDASVLTDIQTALDAVYEEQEIKTPSAYFSGNYDAYTDLASLLAVDCATANAQEVMHICTQDGDAYGFSLSPTNLGNVGAALGIHSKSLVSESIGADAYDMAFDNYEMRNPILCFGQIEVSSLSNASGSDKENLNAKRHLFANNIPNYNGIRFYSDVTATPSTNDYDQNNRNRVWARIYRDLRRAMIPYINAKFLVIPSSGKLVQSEVDKVEKTMNTPLAELSALGEISDFSTKLKNETNFAAERILYATVEVTPTIINKKIIIYLGFKV